MDQWRKASKERSVEREHYCGPEKQPGGVERGKRWTSDVPSEVNREGKQRIKYCGTGGREKAETGTGTGSCVCRTVHKAPGAK